MINATQVERPAAGITSLGEGSTVRTEISTEVNILGGRYTIRSGYSAAFVEQTAALVNQRMNEIIREGGIISTDKVAILASMNLASELLKLQEEQSNLEGRLRKRLERIIATLDTSLSQEELDYLLER